MKKVVSLLAACATVFSMSATAFAAEGDITGSKSVLSTSVSYGTSAYVNLALNEIVLVENTTNNALIGPETHLKPGTEYIFKLFKSNADQTNVAIGSADLSPITDGMLDGGKFRLRGRSGTATISSAKIVKRGTGTTATYRLELTTKENYGTKMTDVEYLVSVTGTGANAVGLVEGNPTFKVGYGQMTDETVDTYTEGDTVVIEEDYPVIKKAQFTDLARNFNYKAVQFEAESGAWSYLGRISGMADANFTFSRDVIPAIIDKFGDQDFEFLTFPAGVTFPTNGEARIDVSDFSDSFNRMYTYLYRNGKLTPITTTYDTGSDELVFRTNYLGSFVITNEQITDTTIIEQNEQQVAPEVVPEENINNNINNENPNTGASSGMNVAVALGLAALVAAGAVSRKK